PSPPEPERGVREVDVRRSRYHSGRGQTSGEAQPAGPGIPPSGAQEQLVPLPVEGRGGPRRAGPGVVGPEGLRDGRRTVSGFGTVEFRSFAWHPPRRRGYWSSQ